MIWRNIFLVRVNFSFLPHCGQWTSRFSTLWVLRKCILMLFFLAKKKLVKGTFFLEGWFHEIFFGQRNSTVCGNTIDSLSRKKISWNQLFSNFFSKNITFTKFLPIKCEKEFPQFPHCEFSFFHNVIYLQSKMAVMIVNLSDEYIASYTGRRWV